jgi:Helicase HerA, central domain
MNAYISEINNLLYKKIDFNETSRHLFRLDYFVHPYIYISVCSDIQKRAGNNGVEFTGKIAPDQYKDYENNPAYRKYLPEFNKNNYIDKQDSMTKWRNEWTQKIPGIVLLMGTENVEDKGGLRDFYTITPKTVESSLGENYSKWFANYIDVDDKDEVNIINNFFINLFKIVPKDLFKLSQIVDEIEKERQLDATNVINIFVKRLWDDWGLPSLYALEDREITKLKKGRKFDLLLKANKFANRGEFKDGLSKSKFDKLEQKFQKFLNEKYDMIVHYEKDLKREFDSFEDFKSGMFNFFKGKEIEILRPKLSRLDFQFINEILDIKLSSGAQKKDKVTPIYGAPLPVYSKMILSTLDKYFNNSNIGINEKVKIEINVKSVTFADTLNSDEEKYDKWTSLCMFTGGLLDYINDEIEDLVSVDYADRYEFFDINKFADKNIKIASSSQKLSNIIFEFRIGEILKSEFKWIFHTNDYWFQAFTHLKEIKEKMEVEAPLLPIFHCKNLSGLLEVTDKESFHFQLNATNLEMVNVFSLMPEDVRNGLLASKLFKLVRPFDNFIKSLYEYGLYNCINQAKNDSALKYISSYIAMSEGLCGKINELNLVEKDYLNLVSNLFYMVSNKEAASYQLKLEGAIIPPYHPALLEKLIEQQAFQRRGIKLTIEELIEGSTFNRIQNKIMEIEKHSTIISGVDTIISEHEESKVPKKVYGYYALHGKITSDLTLDNSVFLDGDLVFDEDFDTKEMISDSALSKLITEQINEYVKTYPAHTDTIKITFLNFSNLQPLIAGVHNFVNSLEGIGHKIHLKLQILAENSNNQGRNYVNYWLDNFFTEDDPVEIETYFNEINLFDVHLSEFDEQLYESDLTFLDNILKTNEIIYERTGEKSIDPSETRFPMVFHPIPVLKKNFTKNISISQKQFQASYSHTQLLHWIERPHSVKDMYRIEKELTLPERIGELLEFLHLKTRWLVTLDSGLDKTFLNEKNVISFSTGEGTFGELNMTISSRPDVRTDLEIKLTRRLKALFPSWSSEQCTLASQYCVEKSFVLDGLKILKALNPYDYEIHSFLSSLLSYETLGMNNINEDTIIKNFISLDTYKHWFYGETNRPDFLKIEINKDAQEEVVVIDATLIECKMAKYNDAHIKKGIQQLSNGIKHLMGKFNPLSQDFNRRYWFSQLYRMLAFSNMNISENEKERTSLNQHLLKVLDGKFKVNWSSCLVTYWLDYNNEFIDENVFILEGSEISCRHLAYGQLYVQSNLLPEDLRNKIKFEDPSSLEISLVADDEVANDLVIADNSEKLKDDKVVDIFDGFENVTKFKKEVEKNTTNNKYKSENTIRDLPRDERMHIKKPDIISTKKKDLDSSENKTVVAQKEQEYKTSSPLENIRILLGEELRTKRKIYWEYGHPQLENRHILISGKSGVGKTYFMQCMLLELARNNISSIIFDYTDGFKRSKLEPEFKEYLGDRVEQFHIQLNPFPINPFKKNMKEIDEDLYKKEEDTDVAERMKSVFSAVYKGMGDQQANAIYRATMRGMEKYGDKMNLKYLRDELEIDGSSNAKTVLAKIEPLIDRNPFDAESEYNWTEHRGKEGIIFIVQLSGFTREVQLIVTEFILWDLWNYNLSHGDKSKPFPVILDEAQNLDHSENSPSAKILTEGRKFGWSGWYATQFMQGQLNKDEIQRLQMASQKIYFSPPEAEINDMASFLSTESQKKKEWAKRLSNLPKGQCIVAGPILKEDGRIERISPMIVNVTPLSERIN